MKMSNSIRKICVEKWFDSLRDSPEELHPDFNEEPKDVDGMSMFGDLKELQDSEMERLKTEHKSGQKVLSTPHGIIPLTEYSYASKFFNFWVIHSNFAISKSMIEAVADIDGIEDILPMTKHRFRISVGRMFTLPEVVSKIQDLLCLPTNSEIENNLIRQIKEAKERIVNFEYWVVYVLPNGRMVQAASDETNEDFVKELKEICKTHEMVGGALWTYEQIEPMIG